MLCKELHHKFMFCFWDFLFPNVFHLHLAGFMDVEPKDMDSRLYCTISYKGLKSSIVGIYRGPETSLLWLLTDDCILLMASLSSLTPLLHTDVDSSF